MVADGFVITGDALCVLSGMPPDFVSAGVTSPPYNKQENKRGWLVDNVRYSQFTDKQPENVYQDSQVAVLDELYRVIKPGGSFFYNHKLRWEKGLLLHPMDWLRRTKWTIRQEIVWDRGIAANIRGWRFWQVEERVYWLYKPIGSHLIGRELESRHALLSSVWRFPPERHNGHPAPFPIQLPARALYSVLGNGDTVVIDPYCGSGTTLVVAKLLGCDFVGIDISDEYTETARQRLVDCGQIDREAVEKELSLHVVRRTFADRKRVGANTGKFRR